MAQPSIVYTGKELSLLIQILLFFGLVPALEFQVSSVSTGAVYAYRPYQPVRASRFTSSTFPPLCKDGCTL